MNQYQKSRYVGTKETDTKPYTDVKNNDDALVDPQSTDDISQGYDSRSIWINKHTETAFVCIDNTKGNAIWSAVGAGGNDSLIGQNIGNGTSLYKDKIGNNLRFKSIASSPNIVITAGTNEISLDVSSQITTGVSYLNGATGNIQDQLNAILSLLEYQTENTITTNDGNWTQITSINTTINTIYQIEAKIVARRTDAQGEGASYVLYGTYRRDLGSVVKIGEDKLQLEDTLSWDVELTNSGTEIILNVKGENLKTIIWKAIIKRVNI